jgi:surfeit locus 1 family protein
MNRRTVAFVLFAIAIAAGCVRLGFWQLSRLGERRARNAEIAVRLGQPPAPLATVLADSAGARYRQVRVAGRFDYENEIVYTSRTRLGSPGVQLITPLLLPGGDAVLVNRGWVYSPNGMTVDLPRWREGDSADVSGYLEAFTATASDEASANVSTPSIPRGVRRLQRDSVAALFPYRVAAFVVVRRDGAVQEGEVQHPFRVDLPALGEGAHKGYALQWFAFAFIAVAGTAAVVARGRRSPRSAGRRSRA